MINAYLCNPLTDSGQTDQLSHVFMYLDIAYVFGLVFRKLLALALELKQVLLQHAQTEPMTVPVINLAECSAHENTIGLSRGTCPKQHRNYHSADVLG